MVAERCAVECEKKALGIRRIGWSEGGMRLVRSALFVALVAGVALVAFVGDLVARLGRSGSRVGGR